MNFYKVLVAWVLVSAVVVLLVGCTQEVYQLEMPSKYVDGTDGDPVPSQAVPFQSIDQGVRSGVHDARQEVVKDSEQWQKLWQEHVTGLINQPVMPVVDFTQEMVIAFFLGQQPTAGYTVTITKIVLEEGSRLIVHVIKTVPLPGSMLLQVLTQPYHIVKLHRLDLPIEFVLTESRERK